MTFEGYVTGVCQRCEFGIEESEAVFQIHATGIEYEHQHYCPECHHIWIEEW